MIGEAEQRPVQDLQDKRHAIPRLPWKSVLARNQGLHLYDPDRPDPQVRIFCISPGNFNDSVEHSKPAVDHQVRSNLISSYVNDSVNH